MNGHVSKPIDPTTLVETVERFVAASVPRPAVPAAEPVPAAVSDRDELPAVPGLNVADGLGRLAGNTKLYRRLLHRFATTEADATTMAHSTTRRMLRLVLGVLVLFCVTAPGAGAQERSTASTSRAGGLVKIPVGDKQDIRFTRLSVNGEPIESRIRAIAQDRYGFVWLGTSAGLYRYDGYTLKPYRHDPANPHSVSNNTINTVHVDRRGMVWIAPQIGGLDRLDPAHDTFTHYRHGPADSRSLSHNNVACIYEDRSGVLWFGTRDGLNRLDAASGTFIRYKHDPGNAGTLSNSNVLSIFEDRLGNLWVGTRFGLNKLDRASGRFTRFRHDSANPHSIGHDIVSTIQEDEAGVLWVGAVMGSGLSALDVKSGHFTRYSFQPVEPGEESFTGVNNLYEDPDGTLWVSTMERGLLKLDRERRQFTRYSPDPSNPYSLPHETVLTLFEDAEGTMWVGTQSGVSRFSRRPPPFVNYQHSTGLSNSLQHNMIWSVQGDSRGFLWIGTEGGLNRLDRKTGQFTLYRHHAKDKYSLSYDKVSAIREDASGNLWFGAYGGGLNRFDRTTGRFFAYRHDAENPGSLSDDLVLSLLVDRKGTVWVGTQDGGLNRLDQATGRFTVLRSDPKDPRGLSNRVSIVFEDRAGMIWLGTAGGLIRLDPRTEQFTVYRHDPRNPQSLSHDRLTAIREDSQGRLWVGTVNGLNQFNRSLGTFTRFNNQGLPDTAIRGILEDGQGFLWLASDNGLTRFDPRTRSHRTLSESDGLPGNLLNPYEAEGCWRSPDGKLVFSSTRGVTVFDPAQLSVNPHVPPVALTELHLFNKPVDPGPDSLLRQPIWATEALTLNYEQSVFTLEFAGLSYAAPEKNRYRYRLEGLEPEWNEVDSTRRQATYTSLPAGRYVFRVQASNKDGVWNEKGVTLGLTILPPWWRTWWFRSLMGLGFVGLISGAYQVRVRGMKKREKQLEAMVHQRTAELRVANQKAEEATAMKSMFLANMSHEIRTPMNAVIGMAYLALKTPLSERQRDYVTKIHNAGTSLLGLINDILDFSKIEAGRLDIETVDFRLDDVIASVTAITAEKAQEKRLEFLTEVDGAVPQHLVGDPLRLGQVIANLINNAIKFTERGEVYLKAELQEQIGERARLRFSVRDTGIGMTPEQAARLFQPFTQADASTTRKHGGTGLGLTICRRLVELMGGEIGLDSEPGAGSTFHFTVSVGVASGAARDRVVPEPLRAVSALVVDDNAAARDILMHALEGVCARVDAVSSGEEAIAAVKQHDTSQPYDVIFMDWRMPGLDGIEAAHRIKQDPELTTHPAVLLVTAFGREEVRAEAERVQVDGVLMKPVTASTVVDTLVGLFAGTRQDRTALVHALDRDADRLRGVRVLLAEDNEINQQIAVELLEGVGATVDVANDGLEAVRKLLEQPEPPNVDVVLMDVQMPEMDGYQATKTIRSNPRFAGLPIIAMTAHATIEERQKCLDAGMNGHVSKPIDPAALFETVERFAAARVPGPAVPAAEQAPAVVSDGNELPAVPGLNVADGLGRVAGNTKLYRKLLHRFATTQADAFGQLRSALAEGRRPDAERHAHTLKGVAGSLGAHQLQREAADVEASLRRGVVFPDLETVVEPAERTLDALVAALVAALPPDAEATIPHAVDPLALRDAVQRLEELLAQDAVEAIDAFEAAAPMLRTAFGERADQIGQLVKDYCFEDALVALRASASVRGTS